MKTLTPGHEYELHNVEGGTQTLQFISKGPLSETDPTLVTLANGTTNEEVLDALIDRMQFLDGVVPCDANKSIITCLEEARTLIEQRTAERKERGVEGTNQA